MASVNLAQDDLASINSVNEDILDQDERDALEETLIRPGGGAGGGDDDRDVIACLPPRDR